MKISHTKSTKFARSPLCHLRALCVMLSLFAASAMAQEATQKPRIVCEHAAPPPGMRWVCKSPGFCDCHLEGKMKNIDDGGVSARPVDAPRVCSYSAPKQGELLVCDSECKCEPQKENEQPKSPVSSCQRPIIVFVPPIYPAIARMNRLEGIVFVQVEVNDDGTVKSASPIEGHPMLTQAAKDAIEHWHFDPECNRVQTVDVRFRLSTNEKTDRPNFYIHPPDEVELVAPAPVVNDTMSTKAKKKAKKTPKPVPSK